MKLLKIPILPLRKALKIIFKIAAFINALLNIKISKEGFHRNAIEGSFLISPRKLSVNSS